VLFNWVDGKKKRGGGGGAPFPGLSAGVCDQCVPKRGDRGKIHLRILFILGRRKGGIYLKTGYGGGGI